MHQSQFQGLLFQMQSRHKCLLVCLAQYTAATQPASVIRFRDFSVSGQLIRVSELYFCKRLGSFWLGVTAVGQPFAEILLTQTSGHTGSRPTMANDCLNGLKVASHPLSEEQ